MRDTAVPNDVLGHPEPSSPPAQLLHVVAVSDDVELNGGDPAAELGHRLDQDLHPFQRELRSTLPTKSTRRPRSWAGSGENSRVSTPARSVRTSRVERHRRRGHRDQLGAPTEHRRKHVALVGPQQGVDIARPFFKTPSGTSGRRDRRGERRDVGQPLGPGASPRRRRPSSSRRSRPHHSGRPASRQRRRAPSDHRDPGLSWRSRWEVPVVTTVTSHGGLSRSVSAARPTNDSRPPMSAAGQPPARPHERFPGRRTTRSDRGTTEPPRPVAVPAGQPEHFTTRSAGGQEHHLAGPAHRLRSRRPGSARTGRRSVRPCGDRSRRSTRRDTDPRPAAQAAGAAPAAGPSKYSSTYGVSWRVSESSTWLRNAGTNATARASTARTTDEAGSTRCSHGRRRGVRVVQVCVRAVHTILAKCAECARPLERHRRYRDTG